MSSLHDSAARVLSGLSVGLGLVSVAVLPAAVQISKPANNGSVVLGWVGVGALVAVGLGLASATPRRGGDHGAIGPVVHSAA